MPPPYTWSGLLKKDSKVEGREIRQRACAIIWDIRVDSLML